LPGLAGELAYTLPRPLAAIWVPTSKGRGTEGRMVEVERKWEGSGEKG